MGNRRIRQAVVGTMVALVIAMSPAHVASATPDPTEPPAGEPPAEEPTDTAPEEDGEPAPEPSDVSPAVWVGVIALVVVAVAWAARQATKTSSADEP